MRGKKTTNAPSPDLLDALADATDDQILQGRPSLADRLKVAESKCAAFQITEDGVFVFAANGAERMRMLPNGEFWVAGKKVAEDVTVYLAFREWLNRAGVPAPEKNAARKWRAVAPVSTRAKQYHLLSKEDQEAIQEENQAWTYNQMRQVLWERVPQ